MLHLLLTAVSFFSYIICFLKISINSTLIFTLVNANPFLLAPAPFFFPMFFGETGFCPDLMEAADLSREKPALKAIVSTRVGDSTDLLLSSFYC